MKTSTNLFIVVILLPVLLFSFELDRFGGATSIVGEKTGRWHLEVLNGRHWFITPEGHGYYVIGINHIPDDGAENNAQTLKNLENWNINCAGYGPSAWITTELPHFIAVSLHNAVHWKTADQFDFQDVFSDEFAATVDEKIRKACDKGRDNPYTIGYSLTDTPRYDLDISRRRRGDDWVSAIRRLDKHAAGKQRYVQFLQQRYRTINSFKTAYRLDVEHFDVLLDSDFSNIELTRQAIRNDDEDFLTLIAERLCQLTSTAFEKYDPNGIVMSEKFKKGDHPNAIIRLAGQYYDIISVQPGPTKGPDVGQGPDESEFDADYWRMLHDMTGKPVFICDHACSFYTPEYPRTLWHQLDSEKDAARFYDRYVRKVVSEPYMPGYCRCQYKSRYDQLRSLLKQGLVDLNGQPYKVLTEQIKHTNAFVYQTLYRSLK